MEYRILGPLEVLAEGHPLTISSPQQRTLLALFVVNANRVLPPDRIAEALWGERLPATGTKALAFHVSRLRDALSPGRHHGAPAGDLETVPGGYVLRVDPDAIDAVRFERLADAGHDSLVDDPAAARSLLAEALGLWRGEPLADVTYAEFAQAAIRRLDERRLDATEDRLDAELALGGHATAVAELEVALAANPLRERLRGLLMLALYRSGRQAEALRVAGAGRRLLSEELGVDPSPEVLRLEAMILAQDPGLDLPAATSGAGVRRARNPYKGLRAFAEADSADFFGREALVARLVARVEEVAHAGRLLAVVGPSGSGKSSVVRAGLIPDLRRDGAADGGAWRIVTMVPGIAPFRELAAALAVDGRPVTEAAVRRAELGGDLGPIITEALEDDGGRLLLVIDQLEELFVRVDADTRRRFLTGLVAALADPRLPLAVVATLRADFLHVPLALAETAELVRNGTELVTPLDRAELERVIVRPAEAVGVEVSQALVVEILNDVERRPGALPLLEFALTELFDRSDGRHLTRDGYAAIGGAIGALGRRADEAWRSLDAEDREVARQILLALVEPAEDGAVTTRRVPRAELESLAGRHDGERLRAVLADLGRGGLLTFDLDRVTGAPTVEIAHEALLVHWSRLADWIDDLRDDLRARRRLADAAGEWEAAGRSPGYLWAGAKLDRFEAWARDTRLGLTDGERAYLDASVAERSRLARMEAMRVRRGRLVRLAVVGVVAAGVVLAAGLSAALVGTRQEAVERDAVAHARELAGVSLGKPGPLGLLLALEAAGATADRGYVVEEAYDALQWALQDARVAFPAGPLPVGVRAAPDGPRGVFLLAPEALMRLAADDAAGPLSPDECLTYLHTRSCPPVEPPGDGVSLGVRTVTGVMPAASLAVGAVPGTRVRVLSELPADLSAPAAASVRDAGIGVEWASGVDGALETRAAQQDLPDLAIIARPSSVADAARQGLLLDLAGRVDTRALGVEAGTYAMHLGQVAVDDPAGSEGQYGAPVAASVDGLLWYPADDFAAEGMTPPATRAELDALVRRLRTDGHTPWCFGVDKSSQEGMGAADWVGELLLDREGLAAYERWTHGELAFESREVRGAMEALGGLLMGDGDVLGTLDSALRTPERIAALPLTLDPPLCWLYRGASTDRSMLGQGAAAVPFPGPASGAPAVVGRVYMVVVLRDRPEVRELAESLAGTSFASAAATEACDAGIVPLRSTGLPPGCALATDAGRLRKAIDAATFRVPAVDALPFPVAAAFQDDVAGYLARWASEGASSAGMGFAADLVWADLRAGGSP